MSADNGYILRKNSKGKFVLQMYFASSDPYPDVEKGTVVFDTLESALAEYTAGSNHKYWSEYGLSVDI